MTAYTDRDIHRWQLAAVTVLSDLVETAFHADLPPLDWRVAAGARLLGKPGPGSDADKLAAFEAWAAHLGATRHVSTLEDETRYRARIETTATNGTRVTITLMTSVY
jgi:hypothetical protein